VAKKYSFVADGSDIRLDRYICQQYPELTRTQVRKLIDSGYITINSAPTKSKARLSPGDRVDITVPDVSPATLLPEAIPLIIIYEDENMLVINKSPGLTVHPAPGHQSHTLVNALIAYLPHLGDSQDLQRQGIVHRLDKDTSGIMVIAKNSHTEAELIKQFKTHRIAKTYIVLVKNHLTPERGIIEAPIGRDSRNRKRMAIVAAGEGKEARTLYQVTRYIGNYTLLEVSPETGRTHQIRVHLSAIGYPVVGDTTYGVKSALVSRQFVHASRLGLYAPASGEYLEFTSDLPPDLEQALSNIT